MASDAPSTPAVEPTKVFVGNLSFKTREADLAHEFGNAGVVVSANIITRGPRSLGYGFVEMENDDAAKKAVDLMNKKEIDGREINVEVAKPRARSSKDERNGEESDKTEGGARPPRAAGTRGGRGRGRRGRGGRGGRRPRSEGGEERPPREQRSRSGDRTPSTTTLFVANLPFEVEDDRLLQIFEGLNPVSAHVVRKRNLRSKGFGFVEFKSAEDQQKALDAKKGISIDDRELIIKVALKESEEAAAAAAAAAAANGSGDVAPAASN